MFPDPQDPTYHLGEQSIDAAHHDLFVMLARLPGLQCEDFANAYDAAVKAMECDFRAEEALMENLDLPMLHVHREQHARMLAGLHHAGAMLANGDAELARHAIELLGEWLPLHIATMDRALANAVRKARVAAGTPTVPQPAA